MDEAMATTIPTNKPGGFRRMLFWLGLLLLAMGLVAFGYEVFVAINSGSYRMIAAGELWFRLHAYSLNLSQAVIQRYLHPSLWDPLLISALQWPTWALLGIPGVLLAVLFGPLTRRRESTDRS